MDPPWHSIVSELTRFPGLPELARVLLRLLVAGAIGAALGYEREKSGKAAGVRTHMLVAMGTTLYILIPQLAGFDDGALARIVQGVATGIGFVGAGTILKEADREKIIGVTTASGIWLTSALGVAVGLGKSAVALCAALVAFLVLRLISASVLDAGTEMNLTPRRDMRPS